VCPLKETGEMITHNYTVMCDEVRREDNGKFILLGVYSDAILFNSFPTSLTGLAFYVKLHSDAPGIYGMKMRLEKLEGGEPIHRGEGAIEILAPGAVFIPIRMPAITFTQPGSFSFVIEMEEAEPILYSFTVNKSPKPFPTI
jgi:hypothetical protein